MEQGETDTEFGDLGFGEFGSDYRLFVRGRCATRSKERVGEHECGLVTSRQFGALPPIIDK